MTDTSIAQAADPAAVQQPNGPAATPVALPPAEGRPAPAQPASQAVKRSHISLMGHTALVTLAGKLAAGEQIVVTSAEDLIGGTVQVTTPAGQVEQLPKWAQYAIVAFALFGVVSLGIDFWHYMHP